MFDAAHIAGLIAGGVHPDPVPHSDIVTFTTHKTLRGPRGGCILSRAEHAAAVDKAIFPGLQGGPLEHVIAAKAVAFAEAATDEFRDYAARIVQNSQALGAALAGHVPDDPRSPFVTSGLRIGTPAVTTQGMGEGEMVRIAELLAATLQHRDDPEALVGIRADVAALVQPFTPYPQG
jgi:glycine hydroxymethyltransferase